MTIILNHLFEGGPPKISITAEYADKVGQEGRGSGGYDRYKSALGSVQFDYDNQITTSDTVKMFQDTWKKIPQTEREKAVIRRVVCFDNPEDVYAKAEELGIDPEVGDTGIVRGFYDYSNKTIYTSAWNGYENSPKNFYHEVAHSIVGFEEESVESWLKAYFLYDTK